MVFLLIIASLPNVFITSQSCFNSFASYDVRRTFFAFLTGLCWNIHSGDSKMVRHFKIGPLVQKLQILYIWGIEPVTLEILGKKIFFAKLKPWATTASTESNHKTVLYILRCCPTRIPQNSTSNSKDYLLILHSSVVEFQSFFIFSNKSLGHRFESLKIPNIIFDLKFVLGLQMAA